MTRYFARLANKKKLRVAGLMSGTSADGVDVAIVDIETRGRIRPVVFGTCPYSSKLRDELFDLFKLGCCGALQICHYNFVLGRIFADSLIKICKKKNIDIKSVDLIGSHGQTICHNPKGTFFGRTKIRSTLQIAEPSVIAQLTGITTVADFRVRDIAAGGQGAPLVPFADYYLFRHKKLSRAIQNIGGIANVTFLPAACSMHEIVAFDTGPGNMVIDRIAWHVTKGKKHFDKNGEIARGGKVHKGLLEGLLRSSFFGEKPPKTTGREVFGWQFADSLYKRWRERGLSGCDIAATATALTAVSIARAYKRFLPETPDEVLLAGGGARNSFLVDMLQNQMKDSRISLTDKYGIDADAREAICFAVLAWATVKGFANNIPRATGAEQEVILGKIVPV